MLDTFLVLHTHDTTVCGCVYVHQQVDQSNTVKEHTRTLMSTIAVLVNLAYVKYHYYRFVLT